MVVRRTGNGVGNNAKISSNGATSVMPLAPHNPFPPSALSATRVPKVTGARRAPDVGRLIIIMARRVRPRARGEGGGGEDSQRKQSAAAHYLFSFFYREKSDERVAKNPARRHRPCRSALGTNVSKTSAVPCRVSGPHWRSRGVPITARVTSIKPRLGSAHNGQCFPLSR